MTALMSRFTRAIAARKHGFAALAALLLLILSLFASERGFQIVQDFRTLERIPLTSVLGSVGGETQLSGRIEAASKLLSAPKTGVACLYYDYTIEERVVDSDGKESWRTVHAANDAVDMRLVDATGSVRLNTRAARDLIDWSAPVRFVDRVGDRRYTERRIEAGDRITTFGWLNVDAGTPEIVFDHGGKYLPIVSTDSAAQKRSDLSSFAMLWLWGGVTALVFCCFCFTYSLGAHRVLFLLTLMTASVVLLLSSYGARSLEADVATGYERVTEQRERTLRLITETLQAAGLNFPGWQRPFDLASPQFVNLGDAQKAQINAWRNVSYQLRWRYMQQISDFPEAHFALGRGMGTPKPIVLPPDQQLIVDATLGNYVVTRTESQPILTGIIYLFIALVAWVAFKLIKVKRMQENIPTSKTGGVVFGLAEVKGQLAPTDPAALLLAPVTQTPCSWYRYIVEEHRGSGKNSKWVTITDEVKKQAFYCRDDEGDIRIFPSHAEIITQHKYTERHGDMRYTEMRLEPDDALYVLGKATLDRTTGDSLVFSHEKGYPYIISNYLEEQVMFMKASRGMLLLCVGVSLMFLCTLWVSASNGNLSSMDFVFAAMTAPLFLIFVMLVLIYNDIVFLKQRCERDWANIQVSLKKRATLIPRLQVIVKQYLGHEKTLMEQLTTLRSKAKQANNGESVDEYMALEHAAIDSISVRLEAYPELQGNVAVADLSRHLVKLENEVALMRAGFNNAVMVYNTRIETFPDNLLAKVLRFKVRDTLGYDAVAHHISPAVGSFSARENP